MTPELKAWLGDTVLSWRRRVIDNKIKLYDMLDIMKHHSSNFEIQDNGLPQFGLMPCPRFINDSPKSLQ